MEAIAPNGKKVIFPDGTSQDVVDEYLRRYHPEEPGVVDRTIGHLSLGTGQLLEKIENLGGYIGRATGKPTTDEPSEERSFFENNRYASQVKAYPEITMLGQLLGGGLEFIPQIPLYATAGGGAIRGAAAIPKVGKYAEMLLTKGSTPIRDWGKAVAKGAVEGGVVGSTIGVKPGTDMSERLAKGAEESIGFGAAVGVLHPVLKGTGYIAKGIWRRLGKKATPENVEAELSKQAEKNPEAAKDLEVIRQNRAQEVTEVDNDLLVIKGQGELELEPLPKETLDKFAALGYKEADLAGKPDSELINILEKGIVNDKTNEPGISSGKRGGEAVKQGELEQVAGETKVETSGDVQAPQGKAKAEAKETVTHDLLYEKYKVAKERDKRTLTQVTNWLLGKDDAPIEPIVNYRGVHILGKAPEESPEYLHVTPWESVAYVGGKGGFGDPGSYRVENYPSLSGHLYYRGGSLAGDPLESTRILNLRGMTWSDALSAAKRVFEEEKIKRSSEIERTIKSMQLDEAQAKEVREAHITRLAEEIADDFKKATFEADAKNAPGYWANRPIPEKLNRATPELRTADEIASTEGKNKVLQILGYSIKDIEGMNRRQKIDIINRKVKKEAAKAEGTLATENDIANQGIADSLGIRYDGKTKMFGKDIYNFTFTTPSGREASFSVKLGKDIKEVYEKKVKEFGSDTVPVVAEKPTSEHNMIIADKRTKESTQRLMRMGYRPDEIKKMKESDAQKIFDDYARNAAEADRIIAEKKTKGKELIAKIEEKQAAKVDEPPVEKEVLAEDLQKKLDEVDPEDFDSAADIIDNLRRLDDPMMNKILDDLPKTEEEIELAARRDLIERRAKKLEAQKHVEAKPDAPKTREEHDKFLAERRRKRDPEASKKKKALQDEWEKKLREEEGLGETEDFTIVEREREESVRELDLEGENRTYEDIEDGVYLDFMGIKNIINVGKKIVNSFRTQQNAASNRVISEVNGKKLTRKDDADFVEGSVGQILKNVKEFIRYRGMSPDFAIRNNPKVEPLVTNLHLGSFDANFAASKRNEIVKIAHTMVPDKNEQLLIKPYLEKGKWSKELEELNNDIANITKKTTLTNAEAKWLAKAPEHVKRLEKKIEEESKRVYPPHVVKAAEMIKIELAAVREKFKDFLREQMKKNLNEDENAALAEILGGKSIDDVIAKYKEHIVKDKLGRRRVRAWLDEAVIRDIAKYYEKIDEWGLDDYITHYERGTFRIVSGNKLYAKAMSVEDAARKFEKLAELYPDKEFELDTKHDMEALAAGVSRRQYNQIVNNLQKGIKEAIEDINSALARRAAEKGLENRFFIKPSKQFSPFTLDRHEFLEGEENVFDILYTYFYSMEKKMALDPVIDDIRRAISRTDVVGTEQYKARDGSIKEREIKRPYLKDDEVRFLERYVEDVKGRLYKGDEYVDSLFKNSANQRLYSRAVQTTRELQANLKLGYAPIKGFINGASALGHVWTKVGTKYTKDGAEFLRTPEGKAFIKDMEPYLGINIVESATGELSTRGFFEKYGILKTPKTKAGKMAHAAIEPLGAFQYPELPVRKLTLAANYLMAKSEGMSEEAARLTAIKANWFQQFTYDMASLPELMRSPTGRLITQFKPYLLKELEFISTLRGGEIARYIAMQVTLGGPRGLVMVAKSLPILGAWYGWTELEDWANKNYPVASRGIGGVMGVDITAAATFQLPTRWQDWLGPTLSDLSSLYTNVFQPSVANTVNYLTGGGIENQVDVEGMRALTTTVPIMRHWANVFEQVVDKDGWVKDERNRRLWHIDNMASFVTKSMAGAEPIELNRLRVAEYNLTQKDMKLSEQKTRLVDDILDAIYNGEPIDEDMVDRMLKLGVKPSTLRRAARFRVLDPKMRRVLMTEIIRRPEILEMYPDAADLE